jgi:hypothetical protein
MLQGTCTNVPAGGADPTGTCTALAQPASSCGNDGLCDGGGGCQNYGPSTVCAAASCSSDDSTFTPASLCDGGGNCVPPAATVSCPMLMCDGTMAGCQ